MGHDHRKPVGMGVHGRAAQILALLAQGRRARSGRSCRAGSRADRIPSAADKVELSEQERAVCAMLADLPIKQRQVMALRYDGFSNREIADRLGIDPSAVRHTVLRAKSRLRHLGALTQEDAG